jgi:hypothetical protein
MARDPELDHVALDARIAFRNGEPYFVAGQNVRPGMRASAGQARRGLDQLISVVQAEGWKVTHVETVGKASEVTFERDDSRKTMGGRMA